MNPQHFKLKPLLAVLALASATTAVLADDGNGFSARFSGFGTFGVAKTNSDAGEYTRTPIQYRGADKSIDPFVDTRLALQEVLQFGERWSLTGQLLAQRVGNSDFRPRVEWLFANYKATDWLDLRAGRGVLPLFLVSDSRNVGYGSVWLRAPQEVYTLQPLTGIDGVQALVRVPVAGGQLTVQPSFGETKGSYYLSPLNTTINLKIKRMASAQVNYEYDSWTFHAAASQSKIDSAFDTLFFSATAHSTERMKTVGVSYDNGQLIGQAEWAQRRQTGATYQNTGWYAMGGYRLGKWTPHVIYGSYTPDDHTPAQSAGTKKANSVTAGVRYELASSVALKASLERRDPMIFNFNHLADTSDFTGGIFERGRKINVISAVVDFTF
jgi:hypothetical protein